METNETTPAHESATEAKPSVVDAVFDRLTALAAKGLVQAKNGLEAGARWLDGRAKIFGELATKLGT